MRLRGFLVCFVFLVSLAACSETETVEQPQVLDSSIPEMLKFTSVLVDGSEFDAATLGGEDVLFWFWDPN